jgi:hypothetical protein
MVNSALREYSPPSEKLNWNPMFRPSGMLGGELVMIFSAK